MELALEATQTIAAYASSTTATRDAAAVLAYGQLAVPCTSMRPVASQYT